MTPAHSREWFTPVWVVPALLLLAVALYAASDPVRPDPSAIAAPQATP